MDILKVVYQVIFFIFFNWVFLLIGYFYILVIKFFIMQDSFFIIGDFLKRELVENNLGQLFIEDISKNDDFLNFSVLCFVLYNIIYIFLQVKCVWIVWCIVIDWLGQDIVEN